MNDFYVGYLPKAPTGTGPFCAKGHCCAWPACGDRGSGVGCWTNAVR